MDAADSRLPPTIFAPGGRLPSVERTMQAVNRDDDMNNLVVAIQCREGIVVVTSQVVSPYLVTTNLTTTTNALAAHDANKTNATTNTTNSFSSFPSLLLPDTGIARPPFLRLATHLWGITAGNAADAQILRIQMHGVAETISSDENSSLLRGRQVARSLADRRQRATQQADEDGLLNATALVLDPRQQEDGVWRVEPTGQFYSCQAAVVGRKAHVAEANLLAQVSTKMNNPAHLQDDESNGNQDGDGQEQHHDDDDDDSARGVAVKDPKVLQECLATLSRQDALQMAVACIRSTLVPKSSASPPISLKALLLQKTNAEWMSDEELLSSSSS